MLTLDSGDIGKLILALIVVALIGAGIAYAIVRWVVIIWTFQVNALWGFVLFIIFMVVHGGGAKAASK